MYPPLSCISDGLIGAELLVIVLNHAVFLMLAFLKDTARAFAL